MFPSTNYAAPSGADKSLRAWSTASSKLGPNLDESKWRMEVPAEVVRELCEDQMIGAATAAFTAEIRYRVTRGLGLTVTGPLPIEGWEAARASAILKRLSSAVGPMCPQSRDGTLMYDVKDTGVQSRPGVRRSVTNESQPFHTDGPWLSTPPKIMGLHCLAPAAFGGVSSCVSLESLLTRVAEQDSDSLTRLGKELPWHRQGEHPDGESPVSFHPLWWHSEEGICARLYTDYVRSGANACGVLDAAARRALDVLDQAVADESNVLKFRLKAGESLWINNHTCAHSRSAFTDGPVKRHYIRTWHHAVWES